MAAARMAMPTARLR